MSSRNADRWPVLRSLPGPSEWPSVDDLDDPYPVPAIYYLTDAEGSIVYIGQSGDVRKRIKEHRRQGNKDFDRAYFWGCLCASDRLAWEGILILSCRPRYNRSVNIGIAAAGRCYDLTRSTFSRLATCRRSRQRKAAKTAKPRTHKRVEKRAGS